MSTIGSCFAAPRSAAATRGPPPIRPYASVQFRSIQMPSESIYRSCRKKCSVVTNIPCSQLTDRKSMSSSFTAVLIPFSRCHRPRLQCRRRQAFAEMHVDTKHRIFFLSSQTRHEFGISDDPIHRANQVAGHNKTEHEVEQPLHFLSSVVPKLCPCHRP